MVLQRPNKRVSSLHFFATGIITAWKRNPFLTDFLLEPAVRRARKLAKAMPNVYKAKNAHAMCVIMIHRSTIALWALQFFPSLAITSREDHVCARQPEGPHGAAAY